MNYAQFTEELYKLAEILDENPTPAQAREAAKAIQHLANQSTDWDAQAKEIEELDDAADEAAKREKKLDDRIEELEAELEEAKAALAATKPQNLYDEQKAEILAELNNRYNLEQIQRLQVVAEYLM
jgi:uncharacterized protein involved in exopolysaccharide biosynthesis